MCMTSKPTNKLPVAAQRTITWTTLTGNHTVNMRQFGSSSDDWGILVDNSTSKVALHITADDISKSTFAGISAKATADSDGNTITSTYLKLSGGTITGDLAINGNINCNNMSVPVAQRGHVSTESIDGDTACLVSVTFNEGFANTPTVMFTTYHNTSSTAKTYARLKSVSKTGFEAIVWHNSSSAKVGLYWIAIVT